MADKPYQSGASYSFSGGDPAAPTPTEQVFSFFSRSWSAISEKVKTTVEQEASKLKVLLQEEKENLKRAILESQDTPNAPSTASSGAHAPWENLGNVDPKTQEDLKNDILAIPKSHRNFTNAPPETPDFEFSLVDQIDVAMAALEKDPNLNQARFTLVPKVISEDAFWKNYFYRIFIIKKSYNIPMNTTTTENKTALPTISASEPEQKPVEALISEPSPPAQTAEAAAPNPATSASTAKPTEYHPVATPPVLSGNTSAASDRDNETIEFASEYYGVDEDGTAFVSLF